MDIWNDLDVAYEYMEKSINKLSSMIGLFDGFIEIDRFDISVISSLKEKE